MSRFSPTPQETAVMAGLELLADREFDNGGHGLAVVVEAAELDGLQPDALLLSRQGMHRRDVVARLIDARRNRPRRVLRAKARGMLTTLYGLADEGLITYANAAEAKRQRWLARGGHGE